MTMKSLRDLREEMRSVARGEREAGAAARFCHAVHTILAGQPGPASHYQSGASGQRLEACRTHRSRAVERVAFAAGTGAAWADQARTGGQGSAPRRAGAVHRCGPGGGHLPHAGRHPVGAPAATGPRHWRLAMTDAAVPDSRGLNLYRADPMLARLAALYLPPDLHRHLTPHLDRLGALAGDHLDELAGLADRNPPVLHHAPPHRRGRRLDREAPCLPRPWSNLRSGISAWPRCRIEAACWDGQPPCRPPPNTCSPTCSCRPSSA